MWTLFFEISEQFLKLLSLAACIGPIKKVVKGLICFELQKGQELSTTRTDILPPQKHFLNVYQSRKNVVCFHIENQILEVFLLLLFQISFFSFYLKSICSAICYFVMNLLLRRVIKMFQQIFIFQIERLKSFTSEYCDK